VLINLPDGKVTVFAPDGSLAEKHQIHLTPQQTQVFLDAERACRQLRLQYFLRCPRCFEDYNLSDGCKGAADSNSTRVVIECRCSVRVGRL